MRHFLLLSWLMLVCAACNNPDAPDFIKSTGADKTERRVTPGPIRRLACADGMDVVLLADTGHSIEITGGANLLPEIRADYDPADSSLYIYNANSYNWVRDYSRVITLRIPAGRLVEYKHLGFGTLSCPDTLRLGSLLVHFYGTATGELKLVGDALAVDANGYGELTLTGRTSYTYLFTLKTAQVDGRALRTRLCDMDLGSRRSASLYVTDSAHVVNRSTGDALIYGSPRIGRAGEGPGQVIVQP